MLAVGDALLKTAARARGHTANSAVAAHTSANASVAVGTREARHTAANIPALSDVADTGVGSNFDTNGDADDGDDDDGTNADNVAVLLRSLPPPTT
jgi:hypothetical protein